MDPGALAQREHDNFIAWLEVCAAQVTSAEVRVNGDILLAASGLPYTLFNRVVVAGPDATADGLISAVEAMRARGAPFAVTLRRGTDDRFVSAVRDLGLAPDGAATPGMALAPIPSPAAAPAELDLRLVDGVGGIGDHNAAAAEGYGMPVDLISPVMVEAMLDREDLAIYVGYAGGKPVASGFGVRTKSTIGVYNIATVPAIRGRGFGAAMTTRIAADGGAAGCDVAILQASRMGFPIYERLGYRTVVEYDDYVEPR